VDLDLVLLGTAGSSAGRAARSRGAARAPRRRSTLVRLRRGTQRQLLRSSVGLIDLHEIFVTHFPQLCECVLMRRTSPPLTFMAFDVLSVEGTNVMSLPYSERRAILDDLGLNDRFWRTPETFDDGAALWEAVCVHELEGVVAKRRSGRYLPGERGWIKTKNRDYWRYEMEREGAFNARRERQFV
jgi:ATP dependent DNA ligase domain